MDMDTKHSQHNQGNPTPRASRLAPRTGFTLVELLVVIAIIGILVSLITVAAVGALKTSQRTRIKAEITEIANGFDEMKNKFTAYPPNALTRYGVGVSDEKLTAAQRLQVLNDLKRFLKQAFPRHQEPDTLIAALAGLLANGNELSSGSQMEGGMTAAEALVFWLGGFSADPKYPISGEGGPSYLASLGKADPIETRRWIYPVDVARLGPRDSNGYFDDSSKRYYEYSITINGQSQNRRINFWHYTPAKSSQPFIYFDTSRHAPNELDPPAAATVHVHALKKLENAGTTNERVSFVNPDKFQVIHCGLDDAWGEEFERTSFGQYTNNKNLFVSFPKGPFTGDIADTEANFFTETTIEDAQK